MDVRKEVKVRAEMIGRRVYKPAVGLWQDVVKKVNEGSNSTFFKRFKRTDEQPKVILKEGEEKEDQRKDS